MYCNANQKSYRYILWFAFTLLTAVVSGCSQQVAVQPLPDATIYSGALDVEYEDALDPAGQLALGIMQLTDTPNGVTADQATLLFPMWQVLQGATLKGNAERNAVVSQIETTLHEEQVKAIQSMRLTNSDAISWLETQDNAGVYVDSLNGISTALIRAINKLMVENTLIASDPLTVSETKPSPTPTPSPTLPALVETIAPVGEEPEPTATPEIVAIKTVTPEPDLDDTAGQAEGVQSALSSGQERSAQVTLPPPLDQIPDTDPGPPLSVEITTNFAVPNPDLEEGWIYTVGGFMRNDSDQTYSLQAIHVTFYDADGFHGAFYPFDSSGRGRRRGGEYIWHGRTEADFACLVLGPGQTCPFSVQIAAADMASFLVHPDAAVVEWHEAATAEIRNVTLTDDGSGYIRIGGTIYNPNTYGIKNVMVTGTLRDSASQWVSFGTTTLLEKIAEGANVDFVVWVERVPYVDYTFYVMAEGDFN